MPTVYTMPMPRNSGQYCISKYATAFVILNNIEGSSLQIDEYDESNQYNFQIMNHIRPFNTNVGLNKES